MNLRIPLVPRNMRTEYSETMDLSNRFHIALYAGIFENERVGLWTFSVELLRALLPRLEGGDYCLWFIADVPGEGAQALSELGAQYPQLLRVLKPRGSFLPRKLRLLAELPNTLRHYDLVHATANFCPPFVRPPLLLHLHDIFQAYQPGLSTPKERKSLRNSFYRLLFGRLLRKAQYVLTDLPCTVKEIESRFTVAGSVHCLPPPLELEAIVESAPRREELIIFCSGDNRKWIEPYIESLDRDSLHGCSIILIAASEAMLSPVVSAIEKRGLAWKAQVGLGRPQVAEQLASSRALAFPSIAEGFGYPVYEALSLGVPVLCRDHIAEPLIGSAAEKLIFAIGDSQHEGLGTVTRQLLEAEYSLEERQAASQAVRELLAPETFAEQLVDLYDKVRLGRRAEQLS